MREKTRVPSTLPELAKVRTIFEEWFRTPTAVLNGKMPADLFREHGVEDCWVVGSCAWMPVVLGKPHDGDSDIDIVMLHKEAVDDFIRHAVELLDSSKTNPEIRYIVEDSKLGGQNIYATWVAGNHRQMKIGVVGCWSLQNGNSIAEHIVEYPLEHQRCAIEVATSAVTRLVKKDYESWKHSREWQNNQYVGGGS